MYICTISKDFTGFSAIVPKITVNEIIAINGDKVTLTLNWGEPFNNLDPIVNYTVSCLGDDKHSSDIGLGGRAFFCTLFYFVRYFSHLRHMLIVAHVPTLFNIH